MVKVNEVHIKLRERGASVASASVMLNDDIIIRSVSVVKREDGGLFVSMPSIRLADGKRISVAYPVTATAREAIDTAVLEAYQSAVDAAAAQSE